MPTFEMTGNVSTKSEDRNIKYKKDFIQWAARFGWHHVEMDYYPDYLIASKEGTIKHKKAKDWGIPIISYEEALDKMEGIELKIQLL